MNQKGLANAAPFVFYFGIFAKFQTKNSLLVSVRGSFNAI